MRLQKDTGSQPDTSDIPILPEWDDGWIESGTFRDLPYDYSTLLENLLDVSLPADSAHCGSTTLAVQQQLVNRRLSQHPHLGAHLGTAAIPAMHRPTAASRWDMCRSHMLAPSASAPVRT